MVARVEGRQAVTPEQEARRNAIAWQYACKRRTGMRDPEHELDIHVMESGSIILEVRDSRVPQLPVLLEMVHPDGTVVGDSYVVEVG